MAEEACGARLPSIVCPDYNRAFGTRLWFTLTATDLVRSRQIVVVAAIVSAAKISRTPVKLWTSTQCEVLMSYQVESSFLHEPLRRVSTAIDLART